MAGQTERDRALKRHREISATVRSTMFAQLTYSAFCFLIIFQSDIGFILPQQGAKLPLLDVNMAMQPFLIVAPIGLGIIIIYQYLFMARLTKLKQRNDIKRNEMAPFLFNMDGGLPRFLGTVIFDVLPPAIFVAFIWKAAVRIDILLFVGPLCIGLIFLSIFLSMRIYLGPLGGRSKLYKTFRLVIPFVAAVLSVNFLFNIMNYGGVGVQERTYGFYSLRPLDLEGAQLKREFLVLADLQGAILTDANLNQADLRYAELAGANLANANLSDVKLSDANLDRVNLSGALIANVDFSDLEMNGAILSDSKAKNANFSNANLEGAFLVNANLRNADLSGAYLKGADFSNSSLYGADMSYAILWNAVLEHTDLSDAVLTDAFLINADLGKANLVDADLSRANLFGANLQGANLVYANMEETSLFLADLSGAKLWGSDFDFEDESDFRSVRNLTQEQLNEACGDENTSLPQGLTIPMCEDELEDEVEDVVQ